MFFQIGNKKLDNFPIHYQHNNLWINVDAGWKESKDQHGNLLLYKGYLDTYSIEEKIQEISKQEEPIYYGNFCLIKCFDSGLSIKTDRLRSFPIWYDKKQGITNLVSSDYTIWADSYIGLSNNLELIESKFNCLGASNNNILLFNQVVEKVDQLLTNKLSKFFEHNQLPVNVFLSGGIDTMLLYSYIKKLNIQHNLIACSHIDFDYFYLKNHDTLSQFWGYRQIHHWKEECVLVTGAPGDEFTVRSPTTANMMLRYHGTSIDKLLPDYKSCLHYTYFNNPKYNEIWEEQKDLKFDNLETAISNCLNLNVNDWQHWHLGNTLTYTPLRDIELFDTIARLPLDELIEQIMNSTVQRILIEKNDPTLLNCLSVQKNSFNNMENLTSVLC